MSYRVIATSPEGKRSYITYNFETEPRRWIFIEAYDEPNKVLTEDDARLLAFFAPYLGYTEPEIQPTDDETFDASNTPTSRTRF